MADNDDVNKKGSFVNQIGAIGRLSRKLDVGAGEIADISAKINDLQSKINDLPEGSEYRKELVLGLNDLLSSRRRLEVQQRGITRVSQEARSLASTLNIRKEVNGLIRQPEIQRQARELAEGSSLNDIIKGIEAAQNEARGKFGAFATSVPADEAAARARINQLSSDIYPSVEAAAVGVVAQKIKQSQEGSLLRRAKDVVGTTEAAAKNTRLSDAISAISGGGTYSLDGRTISKENLQGNIAELNKDLASLNKTIKDMSEGTKDLNKDEIQRAEGLKDQLDLLEKINKHFGKDGGGGGTGQTMLGMIGNAATALSGVFNAAGSGAQSILVGQELRMMQNKTGYANFENMKYDAAMAGAGGDVSSLYRLAFTKGAEKFGRSLRSGQNIATSLSLAGDAAGTISSGAAMLLAPESAPFLVSQFSNQAGQAISGGFDLARGVSAGETELAARNAFLQASMAAAQIAIKSQQRVVNFGFGLYEGYKSLGGEKGDAFVNESLSLENITRMAQLGMTQDEYLKGSKYGIESMGGAFKIDQLFFAKKLERSGLGLGSATEQMSRMANLYSTGVGDTRESLERILSVAVEKGFNNSKAASELSDSVSKLLQTSSSQTALSFGTDVSEAITRAMAGAINKDAKNQGLEIRTAAQMIASVGQIGQDQSFGLAGAINKQQLLNIFGHNKLGFLSTGIAQKLGVDYWNQLQSDLESGKKTEKDVENELQFKAGLTLNKSAKETVSGMVSFFAKSGAMGPGAINVALGLTKQGSMSRILDPNVPLEELTSEERSALAQIAQGGDIRKARAALIRKGDIGALTVPETPTNEAMGAVGDILKAGAQAEAGEFTRGASAVGPKKYDPNAILKDIAAASAAASKLSVAADTDAAARAAADDGAGGIDTTVFNNAAKKLDTAADKLLLIVNKKGWIERLKDAMIETPDDDRTTTANHAGG